MEDIRRILRWTATAFASVMAVIIVVPLASEFVIEIAREQGVFNKPTAKVRAVVDWLSSISQLWWFAFVLGFFVGATAAFWAAEWFSRRIQATTKSNDKSILDNLTRIFAVGKNLATRKLTNEGQFNQWTELYKHWNDESNNFVNDNVSPYEGIKMRYVHVDNPRKFDDSFNEEHNRSRNVIQTKLIQLENLIREYS